MLDPSILHFMGVTWPSCDCNKDSLYLNNIQSRCLECTTLRALPLSYKLAFVQLRPGDVSISAAAVIDLCTHANTTETSPSPPNTHTCVGDKSISD